MAGHTFETISKLWPDGTRLLLGDDGGGTISSAADFLGNAPPVMTSLADPLVQYEFVFWDTGRRLTSKRHVIWHFTVLNWSDWKAIKWYRLKGGGPNGPGAHMLRATAFSIAADAPLAATPIDPTSTYAPGAWPVGGDDHLIDTALAPVTVVAKDPLPDPAIAYDFAGWLELRAGGDPDPIAFEESDSATDPATGAPGGYGVYPHASGRAFLPPVAMGASADLIASYGIHVQTPEPRHRGILGRLLDLFYEVVLRRAPTPVVPLGPHDEPGHPRPRPGPGPGPDPPY